MRNWNEIWKDMNAVLEKHNVTLRELYWTLAIEDYVEWYTFENDKLEKYLPLKEEQTNLLINAVCDDDDLWETIYSIMQETLENEVFVDE